MQKRVGSSLAMMDVIAAVVRRGLATAARTIAALRTGLVVLMMLAPSRSHADVAVDMPGTWVPAPRTGLQWHMQQRHSAGRGMHR